MKMDIKDSAMKELKLYSFIDELGHFINCRERPLCILLENKRINAGLYYCLFKKYMDPYWNIDINDFITLMCGIQIIEEVIDEYNNSVIINERIRQYGAIIVVKDLYYDPNYSGEDVRTAFYKKVHHYHYTLVYGYDLEKYCIIDENIKDMDEPNKADNWPYSKQFVEKDDFIGQCKSYIKNKTVIYYLLDRTKHSSKGIIRYLQNDISLTLRKLKGYHDNIKSAIESYSKKEVKFDFGKVPIELESLHIYYDQLNLFRLLYGNIIGDNLFVDILNPIIQNYHVSVMYLAKYTYSKKRSIINNVLSLISDTYQTELKFYEYLKQSLFNEKKLNYDISNIEIFKINKRLKKEIVIPEFKEYNYLKLDKYFNNIAFFDEISLNCSADVTGTGHYFISTSIDFEGFINESGFKFKLPDNQNNLADNIKCHGQNIDFDPIGCCGVMILGLAEWGNYMDRIIFCDENTKQAVEIGFSDWCLDKLKFDETVLIKGKVFSKSEKIILPSTYHICGVYRSLKGMKNINRIILPNNNNIHIFAITLCNL